MSDFKVLGEHMQKRLSQKIRRSFFATTFYAFECKKI